MKDNARLLAIFGITTPALMLEDGSQLTALQVVRHLPTRRCVCRGQWRGQNVYVKLFFGDKAQQYASRDVRGVEWMQGANILTPKLLCHSQLSQLDGVAVVFEEIAPADNAEDILLEANSAKQLSLTKQLVRTVAEHHEASLMQTDMHLKNFLVQSEHVFTVDGDGVRLLDVLPTDKALANLSLLLSKIDVLLLEQYLPMLLENYAKARGWQQLPDSHTVKIATHAARLQAANAYADKKVFRQCTDVNVIKRQQAFVAVNSHYAELVLPQKVDALDDLMARGSIIKNGNTCTVAQVRLDAFDVVVKRYNIKHFRHGLSRALRKTRAATSWSNAHRLQLLGLETAKPVALIEKRVFGLKGKAYFLAEYIDAPDMLDFFKQTSDKTLRASAVKQTVLLFYRLCLLALSHGDMKATNIKVLADGRPSLIDLDSMQQHRVGDSAQKAHVKDIKRFMQNWKDQPSLYNAFVKVFKVIYADHAPLHAAQILE